jgi:hypothetical protein
LQRGNVTVQSRFKEKSSAFDFESALCRVSPHTMTEIRQSPLFSLLLLQEHQLWPGVAA